MEKIIVNKEVASLLEKVSGSISEKNNYGWMVSKLLNFINDDYVANRQTVNTTQEWLDNNDVTVADIENAFKHGWEEMYEFKVGDIVKFPYGHCDSGYYPAIKKIVDNNVFFEDGTYILKSFLTLVCTAGSREDLKK